MSFQRKSNIEEATEWFVRLDGAIRGANACRRFDANIEAENFFRDLLNQLHGWSLANANWSIGPNHDSIDLEDRASRIAVQVTSTTNAAKIRSTLTGFLRSQSACFDRLIFIYPCMAKGKSQAKFGPMPGGFDFDPSRDRMDLSDILRAIQNLESDPQEAIIRLLRRELKPLGAALQFGVEQNTATIIAIIREISTGQPSPDGVAEIKPDAALKLQRFRDHAAFLKRQFTGNIGIYRAAEEARKAIGYDAARALRCAAWLRNHSLTALEDHQGDARKAFDSMVGHFCGKERDAGRDFDENAVRYFLADELLRCNVFPNSEPP